MLNLIPYISDSPQSVPIESDANSGTALLDLLRVDCSFAFAAVDHLSGGVEHWLHYGLDQVLARIPWHLAHNGVRIPAHSGH